MEENNDAASRRFTVILPSELADELDALATEQDRPASRIARQALTEYLARTRENRNARSAG